jgi:hypothetical protein
VSGPGWKHEPTFVSAGRDGGRVSIVDELRGAHLEPWIVEGQPTTAAISARHALPLLLDVVEHAGRATRMVKEHGLWLRALEDALAALDREAESL